LLVRYLQNWLDLGRDVIDKIEELYEDYKVANWNLGWFSLVRELQCPKEGNLATALQLGLNQNF
jgi:hypothetical protein